jgi:hypothetical protein
MKKDEHKAPQITTNAHNSGISRKAKENAIQCVEIEANCVVRCFLIFVLREIQ